MNKVILFILFLLTILTGCQQISISKDRIVAVEDEAKIIDNNELIELKKDNKLKSKIITLLNEDSHSLEIKYNDSRFIKANEYFTHRLLELLTDDLETEWGDSIFDNYDLALKFEGYKKIHVNTKLECFWFEDGEEIYKAKGLKELWKGYIIKLVDGEPTYCEFEKTVFTEINRDICGDDTEEKVLLFYDGDMRLRVNDKEVVIDKVHYGRPSFRSGKQYYSHLPLDSVNLEYIEDLNLLMYTFESFSMSGPFTNISFYKFNNGIISKVWANSDIDSQIKAIDLNKGTIDISFPFADSIYKAKLNSEELKNSKLTVSELKAAGIKVDKKYIDSIKENIISSSYNVLFKDYNGDGSRELILLGRIRTVGASTPMRLEDRIVFIFSLFSDRVECTDILLERDSDKLNANNPFKYFISN